MLFWRWQTSAVRISTRIRFGCIECAGDVLARASRSERDQIQTQHVGHKLKSDKITW